MRSLQTSWRRVLGFFNRHRVARSHDRADLALVHQLVARRRFPSVRQWQYVGRVLTAGERKTLSRLFTIGFLGAIALIAHWAVVHAHIAPGPGGEYREAMVGAPHAINPVLAGSNDIDQDIIRLTYSGLYRRDTEARIVPDLAKSADVSVDGKTYTFTLANAFFHNGQALTSEDVVFTIGMIQNPAWKSPLARLWRGITASAPNPQTVVLNLDKPNAYLPSLLTVGIVAKHVWENVEPDSLTLPDYTLKPIGTGPFKFDSYTRDLHGTILSYTVKTTQTKASLKAQVGPRIDRITFKFYPDFETAYDKLASNAVDGLSVVPKDAEDDAYRLSGFTVHEATLSQYTALFLNQKAQPALADVRIRRALTHAIDRTHIVREALDGHGSITASLIPEGAAGSVSDLAGYEYNTAAAGTLLDEAGWVLPEQGTVRIKKAVPPPPPKTTSKKKAATPETPPPPKELRITLTTVDFEENRRVADLIKEAWETIGVGVDIRTVSSRDFQKLVLKPRNYEALLYGEILAPDADPYPFWHSSQAADGLNFSLYNNKDADRAIEAARIATNDVDRGNAIAQLQRDITSDAAAIFLYRPTYAYPQTSRLTGWNVQRMSVPADRFADVRAWSIKKTVIFR